MIDENQIPESQISALVTDWMQQSGVPGASLSIISDSELVFSAGYGARDLNGDLPATERTLYGVGSCTKPLTAIAILQLSETDELSVRDEITTHLPDLEGEADGNITIHDLLCHSSGIPSDGFLTARLNQLTGRKNDDVGPPLTSESDFNQLLRRGLEEQISREEFYYYNTGFILLGKIIEAVSGQSYASFIHDRILKPLHITDAYFISENADLLSNPDTARPYLSDGESVEDGDFYFDQRLDAAGGLFTSTPNLATILSTLLNGGEYEGECILREESVKEMIASHTRRSSYISDKNESYGYGVQIRPFLNDSLISHNGSMAVSSAWIGGLRNHGLGVAIACNTNPPRKPSFVGEAILAVLVGEEPADVLYHYARKKALPKITGKYESIHGIVSAKAEEFQSGIKITVENTGTAGEYVAFPSDTSGYRYYTIMPDGKRVPIEFEESDGNVYLNYDRWRLKAVSDG